MTTAPLPPSPLIEALRAELDEFDPHDAGMDLWNAARAVVADYDRHTATVKAMLDIPRPTANELRAQLDLPPLGEAGQAYGTLDHVPPAPEHSS